MDTVAGESMTNNMTPYAILLVFICLGSVATWFMFSALDPAEVSYDLDGECMVNGEIVPCTGSVLYENLEEAQFFTVSIDYGHGTEVIKSNGVMILRSTSLPAEGLCTQVGSSEVSGIQVTLWKEMDGCFTYEIGPDGTIVGFLFDTGSVSGSAARA